MSLVGAGASCGTQFVNHAPDGRTPQRTRKWIGKPLLRQGRLHQELLIIPASIRITWQKAIISHLSRFKRYPDAARARGVQGIVNVEFTIDREGRMLDPHPSWTLGPLSA